MFKDKLLVVIIIVQYKDTISDVQIVVHQLGKNGLFFPSKSLKSGAITSIRVSWVFYLLLLLSFDFCFRVHFLKT